MANQLTFDLALPPPTYAREDFVVASGNREALAWIDRWPDWPAPALALGGPAGCGKTHLGRIWAARAGALSIDGAALEGKSVADLADLAAA
jgi:chromosomal replication initiation ATPase DnaA